MNNYTFYIYPRVLTIQEEQELSVVENVSSNSFSGHKNMIICNDAPLMKISASFIRQSIKEGKDVRYLLTEPVLKYIDQMNFYR